MKSVSRLYATLARGWRPHRLARWRSAGILLSYTCNAACADCYENSGPRKRGVLPLEELRKYLRELKRLGISGRRLHFAGGEPFYHYRHLLGCFQVAAEEGMLPLGKLETNAFWCKNDDVTRERLGEIQRFGVEQLMVSCDAFHQEFVPFERVERAVRIGREILGEAGVRVSVPEFFRNPIDVGALSEAEKLELFRDVARRGAWRMVGRAAGRLSGLVERRPARAFARDRCARKLLEKQSIHIDPHGNVFPSVCVGILLGNAGRSPLSGIQRDFDSRDHPMVRTLVESGPLPLLDEAVASGYREREDGYASKCHLCFELRRFFWDRRLHTDEIGPSEIYTD